MGKKTNILLGVVIAGLAGTGYVRAEDTGAPADGATPPKKAKNGCNGPNGCDGSHMKKHKDKKTSRAMHHQKKKDAAAPTATGDKPADAPAAQ